MCCNFERLCQSSQTAPLEEKERYFQWRGRRLVFALHMETADLLVRVFAAAELRAKAVVSGGVGFKIQILTVTKRGEPLGNWIGR